MAEVYIDWGFTVTLPNRVVQRFAIWENKCTK